MSAKCQEATYAVRQVLLPFPGRRTGNTEPLPGSLEPRDLVQ
jgi:hypothetical protein